MDMNKTNKKPHLKLYQGILSFIYFLFIIYIIYLAFLIVDLAKTQK